MSLWKKNIGAALLPLMFMGVAAMADQVVHLSDGKTVILKDDGTWAYVDDTVSGALTLKFGKTLDQQGRCYAWPRLTNDTDKFIDGVVFEYSTHYDDGRTIKKGSLIFSIVAVGRRSTMQEYVTDYDTATCSEVAYVQIDGISKCKIDGILRNSRICYDLLDVSAEDMQAIK